MNTSLPQDNQYSINILLCTYNGEQFLKEQLASFTDQKHSNWKLSIYDDISTDNTIDIINQYKSLTSQEVTLVINSSQKGFCKNFLSAICQTPNECDFFALSDQDDIWQENKLTLATNHLKTIPAHIPALYCSRTQLIDEQANAIGFSSLFSKPSSFKNALVQSIAGGNTMVFNKAAKELIASVSHNMDVISHDWWIYLLITGCGGHVFYDHHAEVLYRQHNANLIGSNNSFFAKVFRLKSLLKGSFKEWINKNLIALNNYRSKLTSDNIKVLDLFIEMRNTSFLKRLYLFHKIKVYRQTFLGNVALWIAIILKKM
jgi:glycosyltransferase involved in cell wall biosynthesis